MKPNETPVSVLCALAVGLMTLFTSSCAVKVSATRDNSHVMEVSVPKQKMALYKNGFLVRKYPVSTSKFGIGSTKGSYRTPLGKMEVAEKIGDGKPAGAVFKNREWTGEVIKPNESGRDPIVSRILWLRGLERQNKTTYSRCIYIHGTAAEKDIGKKASYGCVRMRSKDVIDLYRRVGWGSKVFVVNKDLWIDLIRMKKASADQLRAVPQENLHAHRDSLLPVLQPVTAPYPQSLWAPPGFAEEVSPALTGRDILAAEGFDLAYLDLETLNL